MKSGTMHLTRRVPVTHRQYETGGVCLMNHPISGEETVYFGWKDKSQISYPVGEAIQRAMVLFNRYNWEEITLIIDKEFTEERKAHTLIIKPYVK